MFAVSCRLATAIIGICALSVVLLAASTASGQANLDLIVAGGRVMDPESGLDSIRHIGIRGQSIVAISEQPLASRLGQSGSRIDARSGEVLSKL